jgi:hypothetical protein
MNMITRRSLFNQAALLALFFACGCGAAHAQGFIRKDQNLPDASRFYMARQQWQMIDNTPIINGQPGGPGGAQQQGAAPGAGAPPPLPRAGFMPYTPNMPQLSTSLPKTNNGVPPKLPPARAPKSGGPTGAKAHAGKLPAAKPVSAPAPPAVQAYAPYKGYNPGAPAATGAQSMNSQSNVKGSVLHWARARHQSTGY